MQKNQDKKSDYSSIVDHEVGYVINGKSCGKLILKHYNEQGEGCYNYISKHTSMMMTEKTLKVLESREFLIVCMTPDPKNNNKPLFVLGP